MRRTTPLSLAKIRSVSDFIDRFLRSLQIGTVDPTIELNRIDFSTQSYETFHIVCATLTGWRVHARLLEVTNPAAVERIDGEGNCNRRENEVEKRHCYPARLTRAVAETAGHVEIFWRRVEAKSASCCSGKGWVVDLTGIEPVTS
jgi:hypothetical protein